MTTSEKKLSFEETVEKTSDTFIESGFLSSSGITRSDNSGSDVAID